MKKPTKNIRFVILASLLISLTPTFLISCGPAPDEVVPDMVDEGTGLAPDVITHSHLKGDDPCPQNFRNKVDIFCAGANDTTCIADSVAIENTSVGLEATFDGGGTSSKIIQMGTQTTQLNLKFTCAIAESFEHVYKLVFFKNGIKVREEDLKVIVIVS